MKKEISVILPAFNEEERIEETVSSVVEYFRAKRYVFEVIVVDDGSTDSTRDKALALAARVPEVKPIHFEKNLGKGQAVKAGVRAARYATCLFMDADNATSIREWDKFEPLFASGAKAVVASRRLPGSRIERPQPLTRRVLGGVYRLLCRSSFGLTASDFNCGFKAYETALAKKIYEKVQLSDWAFDTEVFCLLKKERVRVEEVPVAWKHCAKASALAPLRSGFQTLGSLGRLKKIYG